MMYQELGIRKEIVEFVQECEQKLGKIFKKIDEQADLNSLKVLNTFHKYQISEVHFNMTTGYGYGDIGRDTTEKVFAEVLGAEDALVRGQFISGTHALTVAFFAYLRPGDRLLSISGTPYDTLHEVIGIRENASSLKSFGVLYDEIDLVNNDFDDEKILSYLKENSVKMIEIQRSKGYSTRKSLGISKLERVISKIKKVSPSTIIMVDNCYCEMVEDRTPTGVGADLMVGSLIKNLGGSIAPNGAYIAGKKKYVELAGERLTLPGEGMEVGPSLGINIDFLRGLYMAPSVVGSSLKMAVLASYILEEMGYSVSPRYDSKRADIVSMITFGSAEKLIKFVQGIQAGSAIDANALPEPTDMPGYEDKIIMASGSFIQGSSIEISADGPIREPYIAYLQGSVTYEYGKIALMKAIERMKDV